VLDDWNFLSPQLEDLYATLNLGKARHAFPFEPRQCMAPLPRCGQRVEAVAWLGHADRLARAAGHSLPDDALTRPRLLQAASDHALGPCDDAWFGAEAWGIDPVAGLAVVTGDLAIGASPEQGLDAIRLLMLCNAWRLRSLPPAADGPGAAALHDLHDQPVPAYAPVAVTPDELGEAWQHGRLAARLALRCNGRRLGRLDTGADQHLHFGQLLAHLSRTRDLRAGTVVFGGPVSQADDSAGTACLAEARALAQLAGDRKPPGYLRFGDTVHIELTGHDGESVFGAIAQRVVGPGMAKATAAAEATAADADGDPADAARSAEPAPSTRAAGSAAPRAPTDG